MLYTPESVYVVQNMGMQPPTQLDKALEAAKLLSNNHGLANIILNHLLSLIKRPNFLNFSL